MTNQAPTLRHVDLCVAPAGVNGTPFAELFDLYTVDDSRDYLAHPDAVLLRDGTILVLYPVGHGKGAIQSRVSSDGGKTWSANPYPTPKSWENSRETPTVYRLDFCDGSTKLVEISANPYWWDQPEIASPGGWNASLSCDEGKTWSEFRLFHPIAEGGTRTVVAMASLTRLKENGAFVDKWMGFYHEQDTFVNCKSILSFENGEMCWSKPEPYFAAYRDAERRAEMCEVEVIRSDGGTGDVLCLISRSDAKNEKSFLSFSYDEGKTWTPPRHVPDSLNGERHKADWLPDGRLFITFRSIMLREGGFDSEGWCAWVGTFDDLVNGREGQYRIKLAHVYREDQTAPEPLSGDDTGYCGNVVLPDGTVVTTTYGRFFPDRRTADGTERRTCIVAKRVNLALRDSCLEQYDL